VSLQTEIRYFGSVSTTNDEAAKLIGTVTHGVWCVAETQEQGVGRRGRMWSSPKGNFYGSLLLPCDDAADQKALRSFVAALALKDALVALSADLDITLKWPNDVLVQGGKVAGILLSGLPGHLILGMGVNLISAPPLDAIEPRAVRPVALNDYGLRVAPKEMAEALSHAFAEREHAFRTFGFAPIRTDWLHHAARLGDVMTARLSKEEVTGTFETVDDQGALVLRTRTGLRTITAADVFFEGV